MTTCKLPRPWTVFSTLALFSSLTVLVAQDELTEIDDDVYELSPFTVESDAGTGYQATATLAGTRVRTDLKDLASSISVITSQFLEDTGAKGNETLLQYTTNTEVGGIFGNFAGVGNTQGIGEGRNLTAPSTNTRVRGLDAADNTRNYFLSNIPWDAYNVDRVELQRGPNSILFGVGSPAGIINTATVVPYFENGGKFENVFGSYDSVRNSLDYNRVLIPDELAVRVTLLHDDQKFRQEPAFEEDQRIYAALSYQPKWFGDHVKTNFRANAERGEIEANRPRILTPVDFITPWWTGLGQGTWDPAWAWNFGAQLDRGGASVTLNPWINQPWLGNDMPGIANTGIALFYDNGNPNPSWVRTPTAGKNFGIGPDGSIDRGISGYTFSRQMAVAGFNEYAKNVNAEFPDRYPGASKDFYKDFHLTDRSVFDYYNRLIDGDNKRELSDWTAVNLAFDQVFYSRVGYEFVFDRQNYHEENWSLLGYRPFIGVDLNTHTNLIPTEYPTAIPPEQGGGVPEPSTVQGGHLNPFVGRAYTSVDRPTGSSRDTTRTNLRFTAFGELYGSDFFRDDSWMARLIGRNIFTVLANRDESDSDERVWRLFGTTPDYAQSMDGSLMVDGYDRSVNFAVYLSGDLRNTNSPHGLNLSGLSERISPRGNATALVFDSHWNAPDVDPSAPYRLPFSGGTSTQSENPANYVGLKEMTVSVLNAEQGDRDALTTSSVKRTEVLESYGLTWQGYWWDGMLVPTFGWRHDEIETWGTSGQADPLTGVVSSDFSNEKIEGESFVKSGETVSWGTVFHTADWFRDRLPLDAHVSLFYNDSKNFRAANRVGYSGAELPSPEGRSKDYGFVLNMLDDRISLRVTWYETKVENADIGSTSPLGAQSWFMHMSEAWGTAAVWTAELYWAGELPGMSWASNYGLIDDGRWGQEGWENAPFSEEAINHPSNQALFASIADWYATMPSQAYFDAWGLPIDVSKAQGSFEDRRTMIANGTWNPYDTVGTIQASGGNRVNGLLPSMTINQESKGVEFELTARVTDNWNLTINASKTKAVRTDLGSEIQDWIEYQHDRYAGPAGDQRLWWGGDRTFREYYEDWIWAPYQFQLDANGQSAPEIRPWRFNLITGYRFSDGVFSGFNVGGALRWQDDAILGYELDDTRTKLDVHRPIHGGAESNVDLWLGYGRELTDKVSWRVQLNLRNVGESARLVPISVNPDGQVAAHRIADGMSWALTNTFSF